MGQVMDCCQVDGEQASLVARAHFDEKAKADGVAIQKDGRVVAGEGVAVANAALHQDMCYFEVTIGKLPSDAAFFMLGVARRSKEVVAKSELGDLQDSWALDSRKCTVEFKEGDIVSCVFDQSTGRPNLSFWVNGEKMPPGTEVTGFKGVVYPAVCVSHGCELEFNFSIETDGFKHSPPSGFNGLIPSRSLV